MQNLKSSNKIFFNKPQLKSALILANEEYHVLGRGTGKSSGILAYRSRHNLTAMPRSCGFNVAESFAQILTRTLPSLVAGWSKLGLHRDVHYIIGKRPDKKWQNLWNWREPYEPPVGYDRFISFYNGSGIHLISQDVKGGSLGLNTDWGFGDEAKNLNYEQFQEETLPTMRSNRAKFGDLAEHLSLCFTTSMPTKATGKWILEKREQMDEELIELILQTQILINSNKKFDKYKLNKLQSELNYMRKNAIFYQEASSLENIAILGLDYIKKMKRILDDFTFRTEILNIRQDKIEGSFYPGLNPDVHFVRPKFNNNYFENLGYDLKKIQELDCRQDAELTASIPLRIAIDWGGYLNFISVAQWNKNEYKFINEIYVEHPLSIKDLAIKFANYYRFHKTKKIEMLYDHTGNTIQGQTGKTNADLFVEELLKVDNRWKIEKLTKGAAYYHDEKYRIVDQVLNHTNNKFPNIYFVEEKCKYTIISMQNAPIKEAKIGVEKDKSSERKIDKIPALEATHASDTVDIHLCDLYYRIIDSVGYYVGT
jgi:hypothetical protein